MNFRRGFASVAEEDQFFARMDAALFKFLKILHDYQQTNPEKSAADTTFYFAEKMMRALPGEDDAENLRIAVVSLTRMSLALTDPKFLDSFEEDFPHA